jgi:hypothetical protein
MDELMEMLCDYVTLVGRVSTGDFLSTSDRARFLALSRLLPGTGEPPSPSEDDGDDDGMPVQLTAPNGFETARLVAVSRDGMRIAVAHPLAVGDHTIVRVIVPRSGLEYTFPCVVAWSEGDAIGLAFDGCPSKTPLSTALLVGWRRPLDLRTGWGTKSAIASA